MKNRILLFAAILLFLAVDSTVTGQTNPFSVKSKSRTSAGFTPKPVQPLPGLKGSTSPRMSQTASFHPVSHPLPSSLSSENSFGERKYNQTGQLIFLSGRLPNPVNTDLKTTASLETACFEYLEAIQHDLRMKDARTEFRVKSVQTDELGMSHVKMQQVYKGIPVYGGEVYLHASNNQIGLFNGNAYPTFTNTDINPSVNAWQAQLTTIMDVSKRTRYYELDANQKTMLNYSEPQSELVIYPKNRDPRQQFLAWHITIRPNFIERWEYFVDAGNGSVIHSYNNTQTDGDVTAS
jgi:Zn-dependent metalloprotease